ncbi:hypothetical protein N752_15375 [Desulforamulus aquiferis]|nr:DJ-1/PfpI family protein [Desulforamulus aquiferis]RYD04223.1 hypothetical protein N752_15375 [Desulforamulus aquiferis]
MGNKVALFVEDLYNDLEFWYPYYRMQEAGFEVVIVGTGRTEVFNSKFGMPAKADISSEQVNTEDYAAVIIPGGFAPDKMRIDKTCSE